MEISTLCKKKASRLQMELLGLSWETLQALNRLLAVLASAKPVSDNAGHLNRSGVLYRPVLDRWPQ